MNLIERMTSALQAIKRQATHYMETQRSIPVLGLVDILYIVDTAMEQKADEVQISGNHYKEMPIQPWTLMEKVLTHDEFIGFLKGNIIKYSMRAGRKDGSDDEGKARHYMQKLDEILSK